MHVRGHGQGREREEQGKLEDRVEDETDGGYVKKKVSRWINRSLREGKTGVRKWRRTSQRITDRADQRPERAG